MEFLFTGEELMNAARYLGAALAMGLGAIGSGMGEGLAADAALNAISRRPNRQGEILRTMFIGQAVRARLSVEVFRYWILIGLAALGCMMIARALWS